MTFLYLLSISLIFNLLHPGYSEQTKSGYLWRPPISDTSIIPVTQGIQTTDAKVIIGADSNIFQITPNSSINGGVLLESMNPLTGTGINTGFFLRDTNSWDFFTNSQKRLTIQGNGNVRMNAGLLMGAEEDSFSLLRVNGNVRLDSSLYLWPTDDPGAIISLNRKVYPENAPGDDSVNPYTTTPTAWALNNDIPALRIRHPLNVTGIGAQKKSLVRDFLILPYQYGMAIEYNGIVECWVGEWSIHKGVNYWDPEGNGNGWGGVFWVGDDTDAGGVRSTARNNTPFGGNIAYGELSVEKFNGASNGDLRLRLPAIDNQFHFVYGSRGSNNVIAKMKNDGFVLPKVSSTGVLTVPEQAQLVFDSTDQQFKGYNGTEWVNFNDKSFMTGSFTTSGNGNDTTYLIPHGLGTTPAYYQVTATTRDAANVSYVTANDNYLMINYITPPPAGTNNVAWKWQVKR